MRILVRAPWGTQGMDVPPQTSGGGLKRALEVREGNNTRVPGGGAWPPQRG
jgi:hypothetical protein